MKIVYMHALGISNFIYIPSSDTNITFNIVAITAANLGFFTQLFNRFKLDEIIFNNAVKTFTLFIDRKQRLFYLDSV